MIRSPIFDPVIVDTFSHRAVVDDTANVIAEAGVCIVMLIRAYNISYKFQK